MTWSENGDIRIRAGCYCSGFIFALGWWFFIDASLSSLHFEDKETFKLYHFIPGIIATALLFVISRLEWISTNDQKHMRTSSRRSSARSGQMNNLQKTRTRLNGVKLIMIICIILSAACVLFTVILLQLEIKANEVNKNKYTSNEMLSKIWPYVALYLQTLMVFISTFMMKFFTLKNI